MPDIKPFIYIACNSCDHEPNCHEIQDVRWNPTNETCNIASAPICRDCYENNHPDKNWEDLEPCHLG